MTAVASSSSSLDLFPAWLIKAARPITKEWVTAIINRSLQEVMVSPALNETLIRLLHQLHKTGSDLKSCFKIYRISSFSKTKQDQTQTTFPK